MRLLVVLETEPDGGAAAPHATKAANQKRAREEARCFVSGNLMHPARSVHARLPSNARSLDLTNRRSWEAALVRWLSKQS